MADRVIEIALDLKDNMSVGMKSAASDVASGVAKIESKLKGANLVLPESDTSKLISSIKQGTGASLTLFRGLADASRNALNSIFAGLGGFGALGVTSFLDSDKAANQLAGSTGLVGKELEDLKKIVKDVNLTGLGEGSMKTGDIAAKIRKETGLVGDALRKATEQTIAFGAAFPESDIDEIIRAAVSTTRSLGGEYSENLDIIYKTNTATGDLYDDLLDTFQEYAPQVKKAGMDTKDFANTLLAAGKAGAYNFDKVGDSVKEFSLRALDGDKNAKSMMGHLRLALGDTKFDPYKDFAQGGEKAQQALQKTVLGLSLIKDETLKNQIGVAMFGTQWEDMGLAAIMSMKDQKDAIGEMKVGIEDTTKAMKESASVKLTAIGREFKGLVVESLFTKENMDGLWKYFQENKDSIKQGIIDVANAFVQVAKIAGDVLPVAVGVVKAFAKFAESHPDLTKWVIILSYVMNPIVTIGRFFLRLGPIIKGVIGIGKLLPGIFTAVIPVLGSIFTGIGTAFTALGTALMSPIVVIAAIATAIGLLGIYAYKNWEEIGKGFNEFIAAPFQVFKDTWEGLFGKPVDLKGDPLSADRINKLNELNKSSGEKIGEKSNLSKLDLLGKLQPANIVNINNPVVGGVGGMTEFDRYVKEQVAKATA